MREKLNISTIPSYLPLKMERVKNSLKEKYDLIWTDFLVLCALAELEKTNYFIQTSDIIQYIERNRGWVYAAVKRLKQKEFIDYHTPAKINEPREVWINGMGYLLLKRVFRGIKLNELKYL